MTAGALIIAGCGDDSLGAGGYKPTPPPKPEPASVQPGQEHTIFPFAVGNQWTYAVESTTIANGQRRQATGETTYKIIKVDDLGKNSKRAVFEVTRNGKFNTRESWLINEKGLYQVATGANLEAFSSPLPVMLFPVEKGKTFKWSGKAANTTTELTSTIGEQEDVDTLEKTYSAIPVKAEGTLTGKNLSGKSTSTVWFTPGVGLVRFNQIVRGQSGAVEQILRLKSHTLKK